MKWIIASDIHGSDFFGGKLLDAFQRENGDRLLLLGDLLYHGPRNDLPTEYDPKSLVGRLNAIKEKVVSVRGNCDSEVDQIVLKFPIMSDYNILEIDGKTIFATHGHIYNENNMPPLGLCDILLTGHTHVPKFTKHLDYIYMNPGSVSIPKENSWNGYMVLENGIFIWKDLDGNEKLRL
ncbi:MAG: phosphodiesterase [Lachnospirales bacterium]